MHEDDLLGFLFRFYPSLQKGLRYPEIFEFRDDPRLTHQVQLTQALKASLTSGVYEIGQLRILLTSNYNLSNTLCNRLIRWDATLSKVK